jgi:succinate--hydroxymethylglutarate CoA-transferase
LSSDAPKASSHLPPESAYFLAVNRNKRSITVNFKKPKGLEILHQLVAKADVLVENFIPGKLDSMGLGYPDCNAINEKLIYASITGTSFFVRPRTPLTLVFSGYGQTGPYRTAAGYDVVIEGEAGLMHMLVEERQKAL